MEWVVLGLLILKSMTIYELNSAFSKGLSLIYSASYGNLQYAVKKILKEDLISFVETVENGRNKKIYSINQSGKKAFFQWMHAEIDINKLETILLTKIFFLGLIEKTADRISIIEEMLKKTEAVERNLMEMDNAYSKLTFAEEEKDIAFYQLKTLDYGITAHTSVKNWLKELLAQEGQTS